MIVHHRKVNIFKIFASHKNLTGYRTINKPNYYTDNPRHKIYEHSMTHMVT